LSFGSAKRNTKERHRERDRERSRERDRERSRERDRERQRETERGQERETHTERGQERETEREVKRETERHTERERQREVKIEQGIEERELTFVSELHETGRALLIERMRSRGEERRRRRTDPFVPWFEERKIHEPHEGVATTDSNRCAGQDHRDDGEDLSELVADREVVLDRADGKSAEGKG
jgi:hypothetical protein